MEPPTFGGTNASIVIHVSRMFAAMIVANHPMSGVLVIHQWGVLKVAKESQTMYTHVSTVFQEQTQTA